MVTTERAGTELGLTSDTVIGRRVVEIGETPSTQQDARALLEQGAEHGTAVFTRRQTEGRGRGGRQWVSPERGLYTSVILRPSMPIAQAPRLTSLACVGLLDGLQGLGLDPRIKWPNDVVFAADTPGPIGPYRKAAGILVELQMGPLPSGEPAGPAGWAAVLGFGLNLSAPPGGWPAELAERATDLSAQVWANGPVHDDEAVLGSCLEGLEGWLAAPQTPGLFDAALDRLRQASATLGRQVDIPEEGIVGAAVGLDTDGALLVDAGGQRRRILAGDVWEAAPVGEDPAG
jgi:BirA family biotin operon repressor/biotin-[acetyl-CoA-carboxylase] ligase